jgi:hypothetical protein
VFRSPSVHFLPWDLSLRQLHYDIIALMQQYEATDGRG